MTTQTTSVVLARASERSRCIATMVTAFAADPLIRWMLPEPSDYLTHFPDLVGHYAGDAFDHGSAYRTDDFSGCALWLPPGAGPDEEALGAVLQEGVAEERLGEIFALMERIGAAHPAEPHWFLPAIGVDPMGQGRGIGAALMAASLERCDADGVPAYLESSNTRNIPFYERLGFAITERIQEGDSPVVTAMVRPAR